MSRGRGRRFPASGSDVLLDEDEEDVDASPRARGRRTEIPAGTPIRRLPPGVAEGTLPLHWPNPKMTTVANEGKTSMARKKKEWIQEEGSLGQGFLVTMSFADRKKAMARAMMREKKEHDGDYKAAYRSALGKVQALERNRTLRKRYGQELVQIREWFVDQYGEGSKRWPADRAANRGTRTANAGEIRRLKNACMAIPAR
ncbi:MAG: hypothetical protein Q8Q14_07280 [Gemmatimonadales bacterium]|nr:hypothetical protein [Gemmatimonadales bacterium]